MWLLVILLMFGQSCSAPRGMESGETPDSQQAPGILGKGRIQQAGCCNLNITRRGHLPPVVDPSVLPARGMLSYLAIQFGNHLRRGVVLVLVLVSPYLGNGQVRLLPHIAASYGLPGTSVIVK